MPLMGVLQKGQEGLIANCW